MIVTLLDKVAPVANAISQPPVATVRNLSLPPAGMSVGTYRGHSLIGLAASSLVTPYTYSWSDYNFPDAAAIGTVLPFNSALDYIQSFIGTFPANFSALTAPIPNANFSWDVPPPTPTVVSNAFAMLGCHTYFPNLNATYPNDLIFDSVPVLSARRLVKDGNNYDDFLYRVTSTQIELLDGSSNLSSWNSIKTLYGLSDETIAVTLCDFPRAMLNAHWSIPLTPAPGFVNQGYAFQSVPLNSNGAFGYLVIQESTPIRNSSFYFNYPNGQPGFYNWCTPPFNTRMIFQNYCFAVPNFYLKREVENVE